MSLSDLRRKIDSRDACLGVIGLGYVGLPLACVLVEAGFTVIGVDVSNEQVSAVNLGRSPVEGREPGLEASLSAAHQSGKLRASTDYADLANAEIVLVAVETPVDDHHKPDYTALISVCNSLGDVIQSGVLVIIESTLSPGTTDNLVSPVLESSSGLKCGVDFYLGHCPERVMPGRLLHNLRSMSRVCGGTTPDTAQTMITLYRLFVGADLDATDALTAELVKTVENAYRDVQIAFANEVALICEAVGGDVWRVRELVNKSPERQMHLPGAGVGGHCIPKDPWLLANSANEAGTRPRLIPSAREVNDSMPGHMLDLLRDALDEVGKPLSEARILVLGYAYLQDSDDTRNSPSVAFIKQVEALDAQTVIHDPYIQQFRGDLYKLAHGCDAAIIFVRHTPYLSLDLERLSASLRIPVLVDGRNMIIPENAREAGFVFRSMGRSIKKVSG